MLGLGRDSRARRGRLGFRGEEQNLEEIALGLGPSVEFRASKQY